MSHSTISGDTIFHHNGGYEGDIVIVRDGESFVVPFEDLKSLVADYVRDHKINAIELMSDEHLLNN